MEEQTPLAAKRPKPQPLSSTTTTTEDVVVGVVVSSKTQSKNRKRKASSKSDILFRTDKLRFRTRRRNRWLGVGGSLPPKAARNMTCPASSTYRQKLDLPLGPPTDDGNKRKDGEINAGEKMWSKFEMLDDQTAFGAVDIVDRFLSTQLVSMKEADYVGVAALLFAMKYYESMAFEKPSLHELIGYMFEDDPNRLHRCRTRFMEIKIFDALGWEIDVPTVYTYLIQFIEASETPITMTMLDMALFYAKMGMWRNRMVAMLPPQQR